MYTSLLVTQGTRWVGQQVWVDSWVCVHVHLKWCVKLTIELQKLLKNTDRFKQYN